MTGRTMIYAEQSKTLYIGRVGENRARRVIFDVSSWRGLYGDGVTQLLVQRVGDAEPYPAALTTDGDRVIWLITATDTAKPGRTGRAELRYTVGDTLIKSETWATVVLDALGEPGEPPGEPEQGWLDQMVQVGAQAQEAASAANAAKADAEAASATASENAAQTARDRDDAQRARRAIENMAVAAVTLDSTKPAAVTKTTADGVVKLTFGIPHGENGKDGVTPERGTDYWTDSDKAEIVANVLTALPTWKGGGY